jgi:CO dehydrogenase/acetyl-CoA synthase epsilon subunit
VQKEEEEKTIREIEKMLADFEWKGGQSYRDLAICLIRYFHAKKGKEIVEK